MEIIKINKKDKKYPQRLLKVKNFPTEIYALGNIELLNSEYTIGVVGSRECTEYGIRVASNFSKEFSKQGICVISGMAIGIDGISHNVALKEKGKTVAVLGSGFNYIYPTENEWLFHKILENGGCIISEYPPETEPDNNNFPTRNRIISGLSDAVLIVEAKYRSGSSITAKYAWKGGKTVFAVPNTIYISTGVGTNRLLQEGAILAMTPMEIIKNIKENKEKVVKNENKEKLIIETIPKEYIEIYRLLSDEPIHINELAKKINKPIFEVNSIITIMEIEGYAYQPQMNYFTRNII